MYKAVKEYEKCCGVRGRDMFCRKEEAWNKDKFWECY